MEQELLRMIIQSGKATGLLLEILEQSLQSNDTELLDSKLQEVAKLNQEAYAIQTSLITQADPTQVSLLAVHSQDHLMNSYLLEQLTHFLMKQSQEIHALKQRVQQLESR
ncbi:MAG: PTS lactose/cellobiose transporter subunit IIA [Aerococcaceae bacterium]|nr:PTS lactose/cellobiose transporter subunit IIA [Aerococcaceae bacterium]